MTTLYNLAGQYKQLAEQLATMDLDAQTVADTIEASGLVDDIQTKAQGVLMVAKSAEQYLPAIDAEIERLQSLKARHAKVAAGLRDYLKTHMLGAGIQRIDCPLFTVSLRNNPPAVDVFDAEQIPADYWHAPEPKPAIVKAQIAAALKAGIDVPGARLVVNTRLDIK